MEKILSGKSSVPDKNKSKVGIMEKNPTNFDLSGYIELLETGKKYMELMNKYRCAIMEVETKLHVLDSEFSLQYDRNPFESIKSRLKSPRSIIEKLERKGQITDEASFAKSIEENLYDVAGIRVVCAFQEDIYRLAQLLVQQDDIQLIRTKDYIRNPKPNGYRSLHLIVEVPVFLAGGKTPVKVEVQFRTIAMDFWASVDHKLRYKKDVANEAEIVEKLRQCATTISELDNEMQRIRTMIEEQ